MFHRESNKLKIGITLLAKVVSSSYGTIASWKLFVDSWLQLDLDMKVCMDQRFMAFPTSYCEDVEKFHLPVS